MKAGERLKTLLAERGWSGYRLAHEAGVPMSTVRGVLSGAEPSLRTLEALCRSMHLTLSQFFEEESAPGLTEEERGLLFRWSCMREKDRVLISELMDVLRRKDR